MPSGPEEERSARCTLAPSFTANNPVRWLHPPGLEFLLAEHPDGASLGPEKGPTFEHGGCVEGAAGTLGQCHNEPWRQLRESGSFPKPEALHPHLSRQEQQGCRGQLRHHHGAQPLHPSEKVLRPQELQPRSSLPQVRPWLQPPTVRDLGCTGKPRLMLIWGSTEETTAAPKSQSPSETIAQGGP